MNAKPLIALSALVLTTWLFASNAPAGPTAAMTTRVTPPSSEQQTTSDNGNVHGDAGVASPNGGPGGGDKCRPPRCRRMNIQQPVPSNHNNDITGGAGLSPAPGGSYENVPLQTPHECFVACMHTVNNEDRCIDDCYKS